MVNKYYEANYRFPKDAHTLIAIDILCISRLFARPGAANTLFL